MDLRNVGILPHGVTTHKTPSSIIIAVKASKLANRFKMLTKFQSNLQVVIGSLCECCINERFKYNHYGLESHGGLLRATGRRS
jgi:hypothetical protein